MNTKFRVWDKSTNQYIDSEYFRITGHGTVDNYTIEKDNDENCVIEQFTGALDKSGKEIYIGDILSVHDEKARKYLNGEVIWSKEYLTYFVKFWVDKSRENSHYWSEYLSYIINDNYEIEIIGNINENSDLLKVT